MLYSTVLVRGCGLCGRGRGVMAGERVVVHAGSVVSNEHYCSGDRALRGGPGLIPTHPQSSRYLFHMFHTLLQVISCYSLSLTA